MNKKLLSLIMFSIILISVVQVSAFFTRDHLYHTLKAFDEVSPEESEIVRQCADKIDLVLDANTGQDIFVLRYTDDEGVKSYIGTHQRVSGYNRCLEEAGSDLEMRCWCYGGGTHIVQDTFSHTDGGMVPKYLSRYFTSNVPGHMATESSMELKNRDLLIDDPLVSSGKLEFYDSIVLNNAFEQTGGDIKYLQLLSTMSGVSINEVKRDANVFRGGYLGEGFFDSVYGEKLQIPVIFWYVSIGLLLIGLLIPLFLLFLRFFGIRFTWWVWVFILIYLFIAFIGLMLLISLWTNNTWEWVRLSLTLLPIKVSDADVLKYNQRSIDATKEFLRTGQLAFDDASGLTFEDREGNIVEGALHKAESSFTYLAIFFLLPLFLFTNIFLLYKSMRLSNKPSRVNSIVNTIGWVLATIYGFILIGWIFLLIFA